MKSLDVPYTCMCVSLTGSAAEGVADLEQFKHDSDVQKIAEETAKLAEDLQEEEKKSSSSDSSSDEEEKK